MSPLQEDSFEMDTATIRDRSFKEPASFQLPISPRKMSHPSRPTSEKPRVHDDLRIGVTPPHCPLLSEPHRPLLLTAQKTKHISTPCPRRKIFGGIIINNPTPCTHPSTPTQSPRKVFDFHRFTPSPKFINESGERYRPISKLSSRFAYLPAVPTPFKRLYLEDGSAACLQGTYPMQRLPSILRQSSYRKLPVAFDDEKHDNPAETKTSMNVRNRTTSGRIPEEKKTNEEGNDDDTAPVSPSQSSWGANRVLFDPRITVIEFQGDFQRQWISEPELEKYKRETIALAENYLKHHPELIERYSIPIKDSVTCTLRRRALFSLPVMSQCDCDDQEGINETDGRQGYKG